MAVEKDDEEGATYDAWFRAQVQEALDDPAPDLENEEAEKLLAKRKFEMRRQRIAPSLF